jgi:hypothetical protein
MARGARSTFPAYNLVLGGKLAQLLSEQHAAGQSFDSIARLLEREHSIEVTGDTVARWYKTYVSGNAS